VKGKWRTVAKVFSVFEGCPAVIVVENGYNIKGYLKGTKSDWQPVEDRCGLDGLFFGEEFEFDPKVEKPEEWPDAGVWLLVCDFKSDNSEAEMEDIVRVLA
jgi:hypothetical protein